jgi:hypothetical protein
MGMKPWLKPSAYAEGRRNKIRCHTLSDISTDRLLEDGDGFTGHYQLGSEKAILKKEKRHRL